MRSVAAVLLVVLGAVAAGCGRGAREDPILRLAAEESLARGKELMAAEKYAQARRYLDHAFEVEPNSASGREALLLAADSLFLQGGAANFVKSEAKYRDFQNRFPTSDRADYVQFQIARSLAERMHKPDRDQGPSREALVAFEEVARLFPDSPYAERAGEEIAAVESVLAESIFIKARTNFRLGLPRASIARLETLLEGYPDYSELDKAYYLLAQAHARLGQAEEAAAAYERLRAEFPDSRYAQRKPPRVQRRREEASAEGERSST